MASFEHIHSVGDEFMKGNFTVRKTRRASSSIVTIQANEKNDTVVKGDEGAGGLTQNSETLRRWTVAGSEMARLIAEFDKSMDAANNKILHTMNKLTIYKKNCLLSIYLH